MAKLPGWLKSKGVTVSENRAIIHFQIRFWHPALWLIFLKVAWYGFLNRYLVQDCGNFCTWTYPYGFVPEAGCPIHDPDPD